MGNKPDEQHIAHNKDECDVVLYEDPAGVVVTAGVTYEEHRFVTCPECGESGCQAYIDGGDESVMWCMYCDTVYVDNNGEWSAVYRFRHPREK